MNKNFPFIKNYLLAEDCITVKALTQGKLTEIPVIRKDFEAWLFDNDRLVWETEHGPKEISASEYWITVFRELRHNDLREYIIVKGLCGDPFKDTFSSLQSICKSYEDSQLTDNDIRDIFGNGKQISKAELNNMKEEEQCTLYGLPCVHPTVTEDRQDSYSSSKITA